ncbi:NlpC/P60 family protein [Cryptosporangium aurantiacum]|uniref:NlpC/P60 family protein n=1 Tax=Cryptosporangium aurantiacum TaxID=134849 RepID=A0A1M7RHG6_9ACTN|nr:NlpC/P60 family protein [Cryptosporangium aurantiacum]
MRSVRTHARRPIVLVSVIAAILSVALLPGSGASAAPSLSEAEKQLDALGVKMDRVNEQMNSAKVQLKRVQTQQAGLNRQLAASQAKLDASQAEVGKIAAAAYRDGGMRLSSSLLTNGSPANYLDQLAAVEWLSSQQRDTINQAKAYQAKYDDTKQRVDLQVKTAERLKKQLDDQQKLIKKDQDKWEQIRRTAYAKKYGSAPATVTYNGQASGNAATVVQFAMAQQGEPYVFGGSGPGSWDCSGLTMMAWKQVGVSLPHSSRQQYNSIPHVSRGNLQPGDIVFFYSDLHHSAIYIGNNQVVHAPTEGQTVQVESINNMPYAGAGRP